MAPPTGGSQFNLSQLALGAFDFGLVQSDWHYHAYRSAGAEDVKPFPGLRSVFSLHPEPLQLIFDKESGIRSVRDLKERRVNVGNPGSGPRGTFKVLLDAYGMSLEDFRGATELTSTEHAQALCDGKIDAFVAVTGFPAPDVAAAADGCGAPILPLDTEVEKGIVARKPYYAFQTLPKGLYRSVETNVTTFGPVATLVTRANVDDETVYRVVRAVMEDLATFRAQHPFLSELEPRRMIRDGLTAPLHPGAIKYFKEKGWM
jgi:TRAP transporter TAXI family solute receptor